jgi:hypothetical protein
MRIRICREFLIKTENYAVRNRPLTWLLFFFIPLYAIACHREYVLQQATGFAFIGAIIAGVAILVPVLDKAVIRLRRPVSAESRARLVTRAIFAEGAFAVGSGVWVGIDAVRFESSSAASLSGMQAFTTIMACSLMFSDLDEIDFSFRHLAPAKKNPDGQSDE